MKYIYRENETIKFSETLPQNITEYFSLSKMIPIPYKYGYKAKINADFNNKHCWFEFEKLPPNEIEIKETELNRIKKEYDSTTTNLLEYLEGLISLADFTRIKLTRASIKSQIHQLENEIRQLKGFDENG